MTHHRLFIALVLPKSVRAALIAGMGGIAGARWQDDAQLHCTVRFLGELDGHAAEDVVAALRSVGGVPIDAELGELGTFERSGRIDTLWVGVGPIDPLRALHAKVDRSLVRFGMPPDTRMYRRM